MPGDLVEVKGIEWPPQSGQTKPWIGLFQEVGFPLTPDKNLSKSEQAASLNDRLVGTLNVGERCLVVASRFSDADKKWYYLLRGSRPEKCFGWTRSGYALKKVPT